jgi:putative transposase
MAAVCEVAPGIGATETARVLGVSRSTAYRRRGPRRTGGPACLIEPKPRPTPARALSAGEQDEVLDEGTYLCSQRTMYRLLEANGEVRERRDQLTHLPYARPELLARSPNELWSWDTTKLRGPATWTYYYLLVILDCFSRYAVGGAWPTATPPGSRSA